ncbi:hypothetical protein [Gallintestinimicrobium sp.]|uniref:hypothetical protein n=1 Tax=Gallintestinimicrobium sp. TaxID=2981655 RepID=UPI003994C9B3
MVGIIFSDMKIIPQTSCTCIGVIFILFFTNRREKDVCTNKNYDQKKRKGNKKDTMLLSYNSAARKAIYGPLPRKTFPGTEDEAKIRQRDGKAKKGSGASGMKCKE